MSGRLTDSQLEHFARVSVEGGAGREWYASAFNLLLAEVAAGRAETGRQYAAARAAEARTETLREALARAGVPLEVLRLEIERKPYRELTGDFQQKIVEATEIVRAALVSPGAGSEETPEPERHAELVINRRSHWAPAVTMTGAEIRATPIPAIPSDYDLWKINPGHDDSLVMRADVFDTRKGTVSQFFSSPKFINAGSEEGGDVSEGTRITATDVQTGETQTQVIRDDYCLITDGRMEVSTFQRYANGTVQITLKLAPSSSVVGGGCGHEPEKT